LSQGAAFKLGARIIAAMIFADIKLPVSESAKFLKAPVPTWHNPTPLGLEFNFQFHPGWGEAAEHFWLIEVNDGIAFLTMGLPKRHATSLAGSRFAPLVLSTF
jgi:hypothetical protein